MNDAAIDHQIFLGLVRYNAVLLGVTPAGPACHTGAVSCFREAANGGATLELLSGSA